MKIWNRLGFRLTASFIIVAVISIAGVGAIAYAVLRSSIYEAEQERLLKIFEAAQNSLNTLGVVQVFDESANNAKAMAVSNRFQGPTVVSIPSIHQSAGAVEISSIPLAFQRLTESQATPTTIRQTFLRTTINGELVFLVGTSAEVTFQHVSLTPHRIDVPEGPPEKNLVFLYARYSLQPQKQQVDALAVAIMLVSALASLIAAGAGALITRTLTKPLTDLGKAVRSFTLDESQVVDSPTKIVEIASLFEEYRGLTAHIRNNVAALEAAEEKSKRFVADVSHELRTPVAAMLAAVDNLQDIETLDPHTKRAAELTTSSARRLAKLSEELLEISSFDAKNAQILLEEIHLSHFLKDLLHLMESPDNFSLMVADETLVVTDRIRLRTILLNLMSNAQKHGKPPIEILVKDHPDSIVITVTDDGEGIPHENRELIFTRFYKADNSRHQDGTGLGLALAKENADILGMSLKLRDNVDQTIFELTIPKNSDTSVFAP